MIKHIGVLLFFCITQSLLSQDFNTCYGVFMEGYNNKSLSKMREGSELLKTQFPDEFAGYYLSSYYHICAGDLQKATAQAQIALNIQPLLPYPNMVLGYISFFKGNITEAQNYLTYAAQLEFNQTPDEVLKDMATLGYFTKKDTKLIENFWRNLYSSGVVNTQFATSIDQCFNGVFKGNTCETIDALAAKVNTKKVVNPLFHKMMPLVKALQLYNKGNIIESKQQFERFIQHTNNDPALYWQRSYALWFLSILKNDSFDSSGALIYINQALAEHKKLHITTYQLANMQLHKIHVLKNIQEMQEQKIEAAFELEQMAVTLHNNYYKAKAYNSIGSYYLMRDTETDKSKGATYLSKAYQLAKTIGDPALTREVNGNYIIVKARQGLYAEAKTITEETVQSYLKEKQYKNAQNLYNNLAFIYYNRKEYTHAIHMFEKSITLAEKVKEKLNAKEKLEYTNQIYGVYTGLIMSYKQTNAVQQLFALQEQSRSSYLKEMMQINTAQATVTDAQRLLTNDEVLLTYTVGQPGEIIITAITKDQAQIRYTYPVDDLLHYKKQFTNKLKEIPEQVQPYLLDLYVDYNKGKLVRYANKQSAYKAEDFTLLLEFTRHLLKEGDPKLETIEKEMLKLWYTLTLAPVEDILKEKKNIIICAADELNYLPFEAFITPNNSYVVATHNVHYIPNTTIWKHIASRNYTKQRKAVIAFGGARFQPSGNVEPTVRGLEDFYTVANAVRGKIAKGIYNFKPELEAMGFGGANYLEGTLQEVKYVEKLADDVKVYTGYEMTESNFKKANATGALKQYKNILISTHGFSMDIIPEFSGVMFSQPNSGDGNEDTFLLVPEIYTLQLHADLVVLSACDTGVGKSYGGEGIHGLNSAFLVAGANATMLSLWPVNDYGTSLTMQNLFKSIVQQNANASYTLNTIKRAFIQGQFGDEFKHPKYWAPFVYNGR